VAALLQQFGLLDRLLGTAELDARLAVQFHAACSAIQGCARLLDRLPLQHSDAFRLCSALALVFGTGTRLLRRDSFTSDPQPATVLKRLDSQLAAAAIVLHQAANPLRQPEAAAAFVRTAGRPQAALSWLLAVSQALLWVPVDLGSARSEPYAKGGKDMHASSRASPWLA